MTRPTRPRVLVIHDLQSQTRNTSIDFTSSFGRHGKGLEVHYLNLFGIAASKELAQSYDLALVTNDALSPRTVAYWPEIKARIVRLLSGSKRRVIFPQDDYTFSSRLDDLAIDAKIDAVWTPLPNDSVLYPKSVSRGVRFIKCLTGYIEDSSLSLYEPYSQSFENRQIDLGQRVSALPSSFGASGERKSKITKILSEEFKARGMRVDVSFDPNDVLIGDEWLRFLGNCRFTVSRKGGSSIADTEFRLTESLQQLRDLLPWLPESCLSRFASRRGVFYGAWEEVSPRLFEAAAMGVCQILEHDIYLDGAIKPWVHYIPLDSDFGNLEEILSFIKQEELVQLMIARSKNALIDSGEFSYKTFVEHFFKNELGADIETDASASIIVDLDEEPGLISKVQLSKIKSYFETVNPLMRAFSRKDGEEFEHLYRDLMRHELLPESLTRDWVSLGFHKSRIC
jgi:hypothetical protein